MLLCNGEADELRGKMNSMGEGTHMRALFGLPLPIGGEGWVRGRLGQVLASRSRFSDLAWPKSDE